MLFHAEKKTKLKNDCAIARSKFPHTPELGNFPWKGKIKHTKLPKVTDRTSSLKLLGLHAAHSWKIFFLCRVSHSLQACLLLHSFAPLLLHLRVYNPLSTLLTNTRVCRRLQRVPLSLMLREVTYENRPTFKKTKRNENLFINKRFLQCHLRK